MTRSRSDLAAACASVTAAARAETADAFATTAASAVSRLSAAAAWRLSASRPSRTERAPPSVREPSGAALRGVPITSVRREAAPSSFASMSAPRLARRSRSASLWADAAATAFFTSKAPDDERRSSAFAARAAASSQRRASEAALRAAAAAISWRFSCTVRARSLRCESFDCISWRLSSRRDAACASAKSRRRCTFSAFAAAARTTRFLPSTERSTTRAARIRVASMCASLRRAAFLSSSASASGVFGSGLTEASRRALTGKFSVSGDFCEFANSPC